MKQLSDKELLRMAQEQKDQAATALLLERLFNGKPTQGLVDHAIKRWRDQQCITVNAAKRAINVVHRLDVSA